MIRMQSSLSLAVSQAMAEAEVRRLEMSRRLQAEQVGRLLDHQATAAARSPLGYDQLLALALRAAARPGDLASPELEALRSSPDSMKRHEIARQVFARYSEAPYRAVLKAAPDWELRRAVRRVGKDPSHQAQWLRSAAQLSKHLWDHPALPAEPAFRGAILGTVTALRRRADQLAPARLSANVREAEMADARGGRL